MAADRSTMPLSSSVASSSASATNTSTTSAVQQLLGLLATMPVEEPSADLVTRTMAFIDQSASTMYPSVSGAQSGSHAASEFGACCIGRSATAVADLIGETSPVLQAEL